MAAITFLAAFCAVSFIIQVEKLDEETLADKLAVLKTHGTTMNFVIDNMDGTLSESKRKVGE